MVLHVRSMDVSGYRHNYEGFYERFIYLMFIKKGENDHT